MKWFSALLLCAMCVDGGGGDCPGRVKLPRVLFIAEDEQGKVWANLSIDEDNGSMSRTCP